MATVDLDQVNKVYENGFHAVKDLSLDVREGEFMVLVGPSGCGKTTVLRMVAGLEEISSGTVRIGGEVVNDITPKDRDIAMVFQNYALYPHMTVADNMDEPLSNLDAKLRVQMRAEVQRIQRRINVATMYVTHDQVEAMTMGDRVAVMRSGVLQQCDRPQVLYDRPGNLFVAAFIGSPAMNLYEASVTEDAGSVRIGSQELPLPKACRAAHPALASYAGQKVVVGLRPEHLPAAVNGAAGPGLVGDVDLVEALGSELVVHFTVDARRIRAEGTTNADEDATAQSGEGVARVDPGTMVNVGERIRFAVKADGMQFFDPDTERAIWT